MILIGTSEIFASHIVYKQPHNFQVLVQFEFNPQTKQAYLKSKEKHQSHLHLFLLDSMDIKEIASQNSLSGKILYEDSDGKRQVVLENVVIPKENFKVIYFDELPLSLEKTSP